MWVVAYPEPMSEYVMRSQRDDMNIRVNLQSGAFGGYSVASYFELYARELRNVTGDSVNA